MQSLSLTNLFVDLDSATIVRGITLDVNGPGLVGIVGANGSGKTTLLRAIAGRLPVSSGGIAINGIAFETDRAGRAAHIGFSPDTSILPEELSGEDILNFVARAAGSSPVHDELAALREVLGVERFWRSRVGTYSAGMRQRLAIYSAFVAGQKTVILDEPFNWLDPVTSLDLKTVLGEMTATGHLVVAALHDLSTLALHCHEGFILSEGRLIMHLHANAIQEASADLPAFERRVVEEIRPRTQPLHREEI